MKLIGMYDSPFVRRVAISMKILGFEFEHVPLSVYRNPDAFKLYNPLLRAPTLVFLDGQTLSDSSFILDYLDQRVPERRLIPADGPERLLALQTLSVALVAAEKAITLVHETKSRPANVHYHPAVERARGQIVTALSMLDARLPFAVTTGGHLDQVAITSAVVYRYVCHVAPELTGHGRYSQLAALSATCEQLPSFLSARWE